MSYRHPVGIPAIGLIHESADALFFERHPLRTCYFRHASEAEHAEYRRLYIIKNSEPPTPTDPYTVLFVAVRQLMPGLRMRTFVYASENPDVEKWGEYISLKIYEDIVRSEPDYLNVTLGQRGSNP